MKILYIESKLKDSEDFNLPALEIAKLPKTLFLAYSIQYKSLAQKIKTQLEKNKIKIDSFVQVLGCSKINTKYPVLLIGAGRFHALNLYLQSSEVYILENNKIAKISKEEIQKLENKRRAALLKFLSAESIGILVSSKPGQENMNVAIKLKEKLTSEGKKAYIFISNNIDIAQFENFQIDSWVNTSCPGLSYDNSNILNYSQIPNFK